VSPELPFGHVLHLMFEGGFRHMPVVDARGRPLGVVSARDALGLEIFSFREELRVRETITEIL
jgi:CBS domain-containing protein